jgi:putative ABC transport system permease protein
VTMLAGTVVGISSLQLWTDRTMASRTPADLAMFADGGLGAAVTALRADPRFRDVTPFRMADFTATDGGFSHGAIAIDMTAMPLLRTLEPSAGQVTALTPGKVVLSATAATDFGARVGDVVTLRSAGTVRAEVVAILTGDGPLRMGAVLAPADLDALGDASAGILADIASGSRDSSVAAFRSAGGPAGAEVAVLADERDKADGEVSSLFAAAVGLLGLTVLIAAVGVGTTTGLSVLERTQEFGLARALGLTRARLRLMIGMEAGLYGLIGAVLGILLGVPMAWLALESLRLDLPLTLPAGRLAAIALVTAAITVLAGLLPARRAARVSPVAALTTD